MGYLSRACDPLLYLLEGHRDFEGGGEVVEGEDVVFPEVVGPGAAVVDGEVFGAAEGDLGVVVGDLAAGLLVGAISGEVAADFGKGAIFAEFHGLVVGVGFLCQLGEFAVGLDAARHHSPLADYGIAGAKNIAAGGAYHACKQNYYRKCVDCGFHDIVMVISNNVKVY